MFPYTLWAARCLYSRISQSQGCYLKAVAEVPREALAVPSLHNRTEAKDFRRIAFFWWYLEQVTLVDFPLIEI